MTSDWTLRPYAPGDEDAASGLFREVFATQMTAEEYRWKLVATPWPYGSGNVWLAESEGRIIGQFAGVPLRFKLHDQFLDIVQGCDVMTAPNFRRQGVLSLLAKAASTFLDVEWVTSLVRIPMGHVHYVLVGPMGAQEKRGRGRNRRSRGRRGPSR